jgi:osmoprotectant transport system permease protein
MNTTVTKGYRFMLLAILFLLGIGAERIGLVEYLSDPWEQAYVLFLVQQHLFPVATSMAMAVVVGLGAGIVMSRKRLQKYSGLVMYFIGLGQTIP